MKEEASQEKGVAISSVLYGDSCFSVTQRLFEHCRKHNPEDCWSRDGSSLTPLDAGKGSHFVPIHQPWHSRHYEGPFDGSYPGWAPRSRQRQSQALSAARVIYFRQFYKEEVEVSMVLATLFLKLQQNFDDFPQLPLLLLKAQLCSNTTLSKT